MDIAATAAFHAKFADLSSNGGSAGLDGSGPTSAQVLPPGQNWGVAPLALSITAPGVVNGASLTSDLAPGSYISIFGTGLAGASVQINGEPVAITAASPFLINTQMPLDIAPGAATVMLNSALGSAQQTATIGQTAPAIFSTSPGQAAIANQDNSANTPSNPALRGSWIVIYATGLGQVSGAGTAQPANVPVSVVIGGAETPAGYAGIAPASTPGVYQVNVQLPAGLPPGLSLPLYLRQGGAVSNTVAVAVQ